ncbi:MAG: leucine-rich repeat domain-containing protein [Acutalibacteraceae bacterium]
MSLADISYEMKYRYPYIHYDKNMCPDETVFSEAELDRIANEYKEQCLKEYDACKRAIESRSDDSVNTFKTLYDAYQRCDLDVFDFVFVNLHSDGIISDADYFFFEFTQKMDEAGLNNYNITERLEDAKIKFGELFKTIPPKIFSDVVTLINNRGYFNIIKPEVIEIPEGVTVIGSDCCSVSSFNSSCFDEKSSIKEVILPNTVTKIEESAFENCKMLEKVHLSDNIECIPQNCFKGCSRLPKVNLPKQLKKIDKEAFCGCNIKNLIIPEGVTEISGKAFSHCESLEYVFLPSTVKIMGKGVFEYCGQLKNIEVSAHNRHFSSKDGILFSDGLKSLICYPANKSDKVVLIPNQTEAVFDYAFHSARNIELIDFSNVHTIGESAFELSSLISVCLPQSAEKISRNAFSKCYNLVTASLSPKIREIPESCFEYCNSLINIELPDGIEKISKQAFYKCDALKQLIMPDSVIEIGERILDCCNNLNLIVISNRLTKIPRDFCWGNTNNNKSITVVIPENVKDIDKYATAASLNIIVVCKRNSAAHKYAVDNGNKAKFIC